MNPTARRIEQVRAREWSELGERGRAAARSLRNDSRELVKKHPASSIAAAACIGLAALMFLAKRPEAKPRGATESAGAHRTRRARNGSGHGVLPAILSKVVGAWLSSLLSAKKPGEAR